MILLKNKACKTVFLSFLEYIDRFIKMQYEDNYKKLNPKIYYQWISKQMYLFYDTKQYILTLVKSLNKQNVDPRCNHLQAAKQVI